MIRENTSDFIAHPRPKDSISAHGASHHAWVPQHLNPALLLSSACASLHFSHATQIREVLDELE